MAAAALPEPVASTPKDMYRGRRLGGQVKAVQFERFGGPEELHVVELPEPALAPGTLLIDVKAASVIPGDWKLRKGDLKHIFPVTPPKVPGRDGAGIVRAVGDGVTLFSAGQRVGFTCEHVEQGSYAERVVRPVDRVVPLPDALSFAEGAALMHAGVCAWIAVVEAAEVRSGQSVLIHAAAGAIGGMAVQITKHLGARVTGTCSARNVEHVRALGADRVIAYDQVDFTDEVRDQDAVVDLVGGAVHGRSFSVLRPGGVLVWLIAEPFDAPSETQDIVVCQAQIREDRDVLDAVVELAASGAIKPLVSRVLPLGMAADAHRSMEAGENSRGRIVLQPDPDLDPRHGATR